MSDEAAAAAVDRAEIDELVAFFEGKLAGYPSGERARILSAAAWARALHGDQRRASGDPYVIHPLNVASILVDLRMDADVVIAALLHDVLEDTDARRADLRKEFGREVEALVQGVTKISILRGRTRSARHAESIRKMLFAMVKDLRVILIKLADKLHNMRTLGYLGEGDRKRIAQEMGQEEAQIFDAHLLVLEDRMLIEEVISRLKKDQVNVPFIFSEVLKKYIQAFSKIEDEYLRERIADLNDVGKRILRNLLGKEHRNLKDLKERVVVVAHDLQRARQLFPGGPLPWPERLPARISERQAARAESSPACCPLAVVAQHGER